MSDRDDRDTPADCRRRDWLAACAAAGCSAPSSVQPQVLWDSGWKRGCCACLWSKGGWGWDLPLVHIAERETSRGETLVRGEQRKDRKKRAGEGESQEEGEDVLQSPHEQRLIGRFVSRCAPRICQTSALELQLKNGQDWCSYDQAWPD